MDDLRPFLLELAERHQLAAIGVTTAEPFEDALEAIESRVALGLHGRLHFTYDDPDLATDVRQSFPWAERIIVASRPYLPDAGSPGPTSKDGVVARFAVDDPYAPLRDALDELAEALHRRGFSAEVLVDDNRLADRAAARRAGVGWQGKSTMVLDPKHGPWIVLGSVVTDASIEVDEPMARTCGTCDACVPACPTDAILAPGVLDARRCLAALLQTPGVIDRELRSLVGNRLYGCDDCLTACPPGLQLLERSTADVGTVDIIGLLEASDEELLDRFGHFYLPKSSPSVLRRNALIVLGNQRDLANVGLLAGYLGHRDAMLRAHAAWALGSLDDERAATVLRVALLGEADESVRREITAFVGD